MIVWYDKHNDELILNGMLDAYFFGLVAGIDWNRFEALGQL